MAFKILGISGSLRSASSNTALLRACATIAPANIEFSIYDGLDKLPYFSPELDTAQSSAPLTVADLRQHVQAADAVIFSTPEYAFGIPGVLKNALDWLVSSGDFTHKPTAVISASPLATGGEKAHASLVQTLTVMTADIREEYKLIIPVVRTKINAEGTLTDAVLEKTLLTLITELATSKNASEDQY
ncbi:NADPH-dependent FMN reductase [Chitinophaga pinensis]|uniref:NAD(P)H-dependent oxidoreductase n=1 Tax=Chitinophaga pinensis TaxID=79329 RepID=A0A5C6LK08_9BACT|nr:NAD(P)H-dependent oxidoreductase [Chitinophaga pinensis]TWV93983.1 NAD(P)H-dependent oxidoreductase [Chitinophaga pinensis]